MKYWINFDMLSPDELPLPGEVQINESVRIVVGINAYIPGWITMNRVEYSLFYFFVQRCIEDPFAVLDEIIDYFADIPEEGIDQTVCEIPREYRGDKENEECVGCVFAHISANVIGYANGDYRYGMVILPALFDKFIEGLDDVFEIFKHAGGGDSPWIESQWTYHPVDVFRKIKNELRNKTQTHVFVPWSEVMNALESDERGS